ncbi:MobV family relaxase [Riemerella anatipestifer]|nr:MobV family relaxase [Riemerella anatipestifer]
MGFAVYHLEKGNISSGGIGNHIDRTKGKEHSYPHADPQKTPYNVNFRVYGDRQDIPLSEAINNRIEEGYKGKKAIRKDAVKYCTHILTGSHEDMTSIFSSSEKAENWIRDNYDFLCQEYGAENIVRFTLHIDEKTPHIHAVTVPITEDGRLSAKEIIGNRNKMQERQDRYAEAMEKFGLQRGIRNTGVRHEDAKAYHTRINQISTDLDDLRDSKMFGLSKPLNEEKVLKKLSFLENQILVEQRKRKELAKLSSYREVRKRDFLKEKQENEALTENLNKMRYLYENTKKEAETNVKRGHREMMDYLLKNPNIFFDRYQEFKEAKEKSQEQNQAPKRGLRR